MAFVCPPRALTKREFAKARKEGKKTLAEIDPKFWKWKTDQDFYLKIGFISSGVCIVLILLMIIVIRIISL